MTRIDVGSVGEYIREQRHLAELSLRQLAANAGVSNPYLSQIERGLRRPSAEILGQIAKALRISAETLYVKAGILEEHGGDVTVLSALQADRTISDRQRQVLLEIYASFQTGNKAAATANAARGEGTDGPGQAQPRVRLSSPRAAAAGPRAPAHGSGEAVQTN